MELPLRLSLPWGPQRSRAQDLQPELGPKIGPFHKGVPSLFGIWALSLDPPTTFNQNLLVLGVYTKGWYATLVEGLSKSPDGLGGPFERGA